MGVFEAANTTFVEKEGIVWAILKRRRKSKCKAFHEKPKQEECLSWQKVRIFYEWSSRGETNQSQGAQ